MLILFGSFVPSVQSSKLSIIFIPVIMLFVNFSTASLVFAFVSTKTALILPSAVYSKIASTISLLINQYKLLFFSSEILPTHLALGTSTTLSNLTFPNMFCTVPISDPSEVETCTFIASLYCPFGIILSSRSLFILP